MNWLMNLGAAAAVLAGSPIAALEICVEGAYPPFSEVLADGSIVGFDIDIANALCARMNETCELVQVKWSRMIPALVGEDCDAIVASMSSTAERKRRIDFSERYYKSAVRFVGRDDAGLSDTPDALAGKVVGVQLGTISQSFMQAHYPASLLHVYGTQEHVLLDLYAGRLDAVLGETAQLDAGFLRTDAGEGFAFFGADHFDPGIQGEGAAIGVRKQDAALRDRFSAAIAAIRADGSYDTIAQRYFDFDIYGE